MDHKQQWIAGIPNPFAVFLGGQVLLIMCMLVAMLFSATLLQIIYALWVGFFFGFLAWTILIHSQGRWPDLPWYRRAGKMFTFQR